MKVNRFKANERGHADYGWLQANYSFSFGNYHDVEREQFGALRVLNDDFIKGGAGFPEHPHRNMEIISIPLLGGLQHKDSMSNTWINLPAGEVQVMSAGTGVTHAERNNSSTEILNLFQIWIIPDKNGVSPVYGQKKFLPEDRKNNLQLLVSGYKEKNKESLKVHQDVLISRIDLSAENTFTYTMKSSNHGVYVMLISGSLKCQELTLEARDAMAISKTDKVSLFASKNAEILFIEVPMYF
jgi:redox-sensitive bicupin YhaK (pirin superfamily)